MTRQQPALARVALADQVTALLIERILDRAYAPGQKLNIDALSREFEVSSSPIREALTRLGFASTREIADFFNLIDIAEARDWAKAALRKNELVELAVTGDDGNTYAAFALSSVEADIASLEPAHVPARFLSPFDPAIRDRKRAFRLFGFAYTIEVFVPQEKRRYGYYVMPILEGERFIGRADLKVRRDEKRMDVKGLWPETNVIFDRRRKIAVEAAMAELSNFACKIRIPE